MKIINRIRKIVKLVLSGRSDVSLFLIERPFLPLLSEKYLVKHYPDLLKKWYYNRTGEVLNLDHPNTFNEKIQWMKLYDSTPLKTQLADKYLVRSWIKNKIGEEYLVPLLGVWDSFDEINFDELPEQFVLKANHGSGWNIIVKDKATFDKVDAKRKFTRWLKTNYAFIGFELHYANIQPKIIAEQYLENINQLYDYKIMCFDGEPKFLWVDEDRYLQHKRSLFTLSWEQMPCRIGNKYAPISDPIKAKPKSLNLMIDLARKLSQGFAHVRVDFYEVDGKIYFGELTFSSTSGLDNIQPEEWDYKIGDMLTLPPKSPIPTRRRV